MDPIFLDYNSTTPVDPKILQNIKYLNSDQYGNSASINHSFGRKSKKIIDKSRTQIASGIGCNTDEIIFTSGATESLNLAIKGIVTASKKNKKHIITTTVEHKAVIDSLEFVEKSGVEVEYLPVDELGYISIESVNEAIKEETILVAILHGNNEIGTIQPISKIGLICDKHNIPLLVDAAQTFGKLNINVTESKISMLAGSAHKIYGPKGSGFLYKKNDIQIDPLIHGGGHEMGLRSGTLNVFGVAGLALAFKVMMENREDEIEKLKEHTDQFIKNLNKSDVEFYINGPTNNRLPGNLNFCLKDVDADWLTSMLPDIAMARGSACTSETIQPSHVLRGIGLSDEDANSSLRVSFGRFTTENDINYATDKIIENVQKYLSKKKMLAI